MLNNKIQKIITEILILIASIIILLPVIFIFITAFKSDSEIVKFSSFLPKEWTLVNFREILGNPEEIPIIKWLGNSIFISSSVTLFILILDSMAAYALARLDIPHKKTFFIIIIATLMIPGQIFLVPVYLILNKLGWIDTYLALIIPAGAGAFGVFLLYQFFLSIPKDLEDAAVIDGCNKFGVYRNIIIPLSKPALSTLAIFTFIGSWNDFLGPLIYLDSVDKFTLPVGIALFQASYFAEYGLTLAACSICTVPTIIAFIFFQKHIIKGISLSGLKE